MPVKVALCCNNRIFGEALRELLKDQTETEIEDIGIFFEDSADVSFTINEILRFNPNLIIITNSCSYFSTFFSYSEDFLKGKNIKFLIITDETSPFFTDRDLSELISKGIAGIFPVSANADLFKKSLKAILSEELWIDRRTLMKIFISKRRKEKMSHLTESEKKIMSFIRGGLRSKEIALKLNLSEQSVVYHRNQIYKKIGISGRLRLAISNKPVM